ncbi:MAG: putative ATPase subunit of terminase (gpP-like) [Bacteroidetes bacterium]|nr:putative ATPase subunit of terminase (gpP-like) [Bacteroidota bacterium]
MQAKLKTHMAKKDLEQKKEIARLYFLKGENQKAIAEKVGVNRATIARWITDGKWIERRAAENITRPELVNKALLAIDRILTKVSESNDDALLNGLGDRLSKIATMISKLDKKASVVDVIEVFVGFGKWLSNRSDFDAEITPELESLINKYQDLYIGDCFNKKQ